MNQKELTTGGTKLEYAKNAYIFFAISVPLTLLTITVWYVWVNSERIVQLLTHRIRARDNTTIQAKGLLEGRLPFAELPR